MNEEKNKEIKNSRKNNTNSPFAGLNPQYNSDLRFSLNQPRLKNFGIDPKKKRTCFEKFPGIDLIKVQRRGLILSKVTKI